MPRLAIPLRVSLVAALVAATFLVATPASAVVDPVTRIDFTTNFATLTASAVGYNTAGGTNVVIPSTVTFGANTYTVTSIGANAFASKQLTSVTIPSTVTSIGANAFRINSLTSATIPDSVTSIGSESFRYNAISSLSIGSGITSTPFAAFANNQLTSLTIPPTLTAIGGSTFLSNRLTSLTIPNTVTALGSYTFASNQLTSLTLGSGISALPTSVFSSNLLTQLTIPPTVTSIGDSSFWSNRLTSLVIPNTVTSIADFAFDNNRLTTLTIGTGISTFGLAAFDHNLITSLSLPNTLTAIPGYAFRFSSLATVSIPATVTSIGISAFETNKLTSVTIPASVTSIARNAFDFNGLSLTRVKFLGAAPTTISNGGTADSSLGRSPGLTIDYDPAFAATFTPMTNNIWRGYAVRAAVPVAATSSVAVTTVGPVAADSVAAHTVRATVRNDLGNPALGSTVTFAPAAAVSLSATTCVTAADGTCTITATSLTVGTHAVAASIDQGSIGSAALTFTPPPASAARSLIASDVASIVADGDEAATITITIRDSLGQPMGASAGIVTVSSTLGTLSAVTDNGDGTYTATLSAAAPGDATVSFALGGTPGTDTVLVTATPRVAVAPLSTIASNVASITADATSPATITITARDRDGVPLSASAGTVSASSTLGTLSAVVDNNDGTYTATLTAAATGSATVSFDIGGSASPNTVTIAVSPRPASATSSTIASSTPSVVADGTSVATITITARDSTGAAVSTSAGTVTASSTLGTLSAVTDNTDGTYTATLTASTIGDATISFTLGGTPATATVTVAVIARPADARISTITSDSASIVADGIDTATITIVARDSRGTALTASAGTVAAYSTFATGRGGMLAASLAPVVDNGDGTYTARFSTRTAGVAMISFTIVGTTAANTVAITAVAPAAAVTGGLATTGVDPAQPLGLGALLLALGAAILIGRRRHATR